MKGFEKTSKYRLFYIYMIPDGAHRGCLKIGEATLESITPYTKLPPNCSELNKAARRRIDQQTKTAGIGYTLLHTELTLSVQKAEDGVEIISPYSQGADKAVHRVLAASGVHKVCPNGIAADEWFECELATALAAIRAFKEGRKSLNSNEIARKGPEIILRQEQLDAIEKTILHFKKNNEMLWNAKMRYGKTVTALELTRRMKFRRVIIATHRPVVESGWQEDFYKIFTGESGHYSFLIKDKSSSADDYDAEIDARNDTTLKSYDATGKSFIYFASIQDLRGSARVGGKYNKNKAVFDMDWDLIINDEAHEGTQTELGQNVLKLLRKKKTKVLSLSGTPFNIIDQYGQDGVYTWDYVMEQTAKFNWEKEHPDEPNPYADLPQMHIYTYNLGELIHGYDDFGLEGKAFNFKEFFRTWTGEFRKDCREMPEGITAGEFMHRNDVRSFLNLLVKEDGENSYPFSTEEYRDSFRHTLWMVPGVKEAKALSDLLHEHPVFSQFGIANVAGEGDDDEHTADALEAVRTVIKNHDYSITLSCGRLTTGVTVKEWTAVFMLAGSSRISAASYLQTIFRAQSPGIINGKRKEHCYVFDFAPDRSLSVIAQAAQAANGGIRTGGEVEIIRQFLNFCPVIGIDGSKMVSYDFHSMMGQIERIRVERAVRNGFEDNSIYNDKLLTLGELDIRKFEELRKIVGTHKANPPVTGVEINGQGVSEEELQEIQRIEKTPRRELTEEEKEKLEKLKRAKEMRKSAISILRAVSIRIPLMIYGADVPFEQNISIRDIPELVDNASWKEFMPEGVTKRIFKGFIEYYDDAVIINASRRIREMAIMADRIAMTPTQRVMKIAEIFSLFKNPDKETVLTPWRVVNMHLSDMLGGWCFYNEQFEENTRTEIKLLETPRFVDHGEVTRKTLGNPGATVLELNSKSGLYPLYVAYSLYRARLGGVPEEDVTPEARERYWREVIQDRLFVLCKTPMAQSITRRTLAGYREDIAVNTQYIRDLVEKLKKKPDSVKRKILKGKFWGKEIEKMKFDAIVGNPPYQEITGGGSEKAVAATQAKPIFQLFVEQAKTLEPSFLSMITPARWYAGGIGLNEFREVMLKDRHLIKLIDFANSKDCFPTVDIAGGLCYFLWDGQHNSDCTVINHVGNEVITDTRKLDEFVDIFIRSNQALSIIHKVKNKEKRFMDCIVMPIDAFGFPSKARGEDNPFDGCISLVHSKGTGYIQPESVKKNANLISKYNVTIGILVPSNGEVGIDPAKGYRSITMPRILNPGEITTFSYLVINSFDTKSEAENFKYFITRKLPRYLMRVTYSSMHISRANFIFVPEMDYSKRWTDEELYRYFGLSNDEIMIVEKTMREMNDGE